MPWLISTIADHAFEIVILLADATWSPIWITGRDKRVDSLMQQHVIGAVGTNDEVARIVVQFVSIRVMYFCANWQRLSKDAFGNCDVSALMLSVDCVHQVAICRYAARSMFPSCLDVIRYGIPVPR